MKKVYITFGGKAYDSTTQQIVIRGPQMGADEVLVYDDRWLLDTHPEFRALNAWLWEPGLDKRPGQEKRAFGFGWCSWKPFIILDALSRCQPGDVVLYTDADTYPIADLTPIFEGCARDGIFLFESQGCDNRRFTRRDCFIAMGCDAPEYHTAQHACGRFQLFRCGYWPAHQLLIEWLTYSLNPMCQTVATSKYGPDLEGYTRHSNEQSILTILAKKYNLPLHREACQNGWPATQHLDRDTYPQLFHQQWCEGNRGDLSGSRYRNV